MAQHYSFPTLEEQEIIEVFAELAIPLSRESLSKPPSGFMRELYERCLAMLTGIRREEITCRNLAATQCLSDPGLYDDTIPEIQFFRELRGLMETVGIPDFSRRDIDKPMKERTIRILSAIINFAKFRLDKMDQIEEYEEELGDIDTTEDLVVHVLNNCYLELENLFEERQNLIDNNDQATAAIERSEAEREEARPQIESLERETLDLEATIKQLNTEQATLQQEGRLLKEQTAQVQEKVESTKLTMINRRQEIEKLGLQVVHSPDKLRAQLEEMERSLGAATQQKLEGEERLRQINSKADGLGKLTKEIQKVCGMLEEVGQEMHRAGEVKADAKEMRSAIAVHHEQMKELEAQEQREHQLAEERLQRLSSRRAAVHETAERHLNSAQHEMGLLEQEREAAKTQFEEGKQFVLSMRATTQQLTDQHLTEKNAMEGQFNNLVQELERYHSTLFNAMAASSVA